MADKDNVIYLETDEDITSAIDKLSQAAGDSVQIVTPKRSTLLQSLINQKLIKKAADDAGKQLIVVTNDRVVTNLAGRTGIAVASQVGETPNVPVAPVKPEMPSDEIESSSADEASEAPEETPEPLDSAQDEEEEPEPAPMPAAPVITRTPVKAAATAAAAKAVPKHKSVPNFSNMQKRLLWVGVGLAAIIALVALNFLLTSAKVTLFAKATRVDANIRFTADPSAKESSMDQAILAAEQLELTKTVTATAPATGKKDIGTKAGGTMSVSNCTTNPQPLVAGTRFVAPDGKVFRSTADATVPAASYPVGICIAGKTNVSVTADANGDSYNLGPADYTIPGLNNPAVTAKGGQMSGGTSKTVQVVTAGDVEKAKAEALEKDKTAAEKELSNKAKNKVLIDISFEQKVNSAISAPEVGAEAAQSKLVLDLAYTVLTVDKKEFSDLAKAQEQKQLGGQNEIYDDGSSKAKFAKGKTPNEFTAALVAYAGAKIDKEALAKEMKGKKYGDAVDIAAKTAGIERAEIKLSPGWATSMPWLTSRIKIDIKVSDVGR